MQRRYMLLVFLLFVLTLGVRANQDTLSAQVLRLLTRVNTWTVMQTFTGGITVSSCTGCSGGESTAVPWEHNVTSYGAVCNGSTDDSVAIQAAFDAAAAIEGAVIFPSTGYCAIASTVVLGGGGVAGTTDHFLSIRGSNPITSGLLWTGSTSGTAVQVSRNKYFEISGIGIQNNVAVGTTVGLLVNGPLETGTQSLAGIFERMLIEGFATGVQCGQYTNKAASEILWRSMTFVSNTTAWKNGSLNTLDHSFSMLQMNANGTGLDIGSGSVYVDGGSASNSTVRDFYIHNAGGTYSIKSFRSEGAALFLDSDEPSGEQAVLLDGVFIVNPTEASDITIRYGGNLTIQSSNIAGKVYVSQPGGLSTLSVHDTYIQGDTTIPIFFNTSYAWGQTSVSFARNIFYIEGGSPAAFLYDDVEGVIVAGVFSSTMTITKKPPTPGGANPYTPLPISSLLLNRVTSLSQGSNGTARNLRLQATFATAATVAVAFTKVITITTTAGSSTFALTAGDIKIPGDFGRQMVLHTDGGDMTGYISGCGSATSCTFQVTYNPASSSITNDTITADVGQNEDNANYLVFVTPSANETISVSSKATTGFTLTSSNATSTAACDLLIVR